MKDRSHQKRMQPAPVKLPVLECPPLTPAEAERARQMRNQAHAQCPEFVPFLANLVEEGLVRGWRDVIDCHPYKPR